MMFKKTQTTGRRSLPFLPGKFIMDDVLEYVDNQVFHREAGQR